MEKIKKIFAYLKAGLYKHRFLAAVLFLAALLQLGIALNMDSYFFDETVSVLIAKKNLSELWNYLQWEMHPPLHYFYLHFWILLFEDKEITVRLSSTFISLLSITAIYLLGKQVFLNKTTRFLVCFMAAILPLLAFYSICARMYLLLFLLSTLSFWSYLKIINKLQNGNKPKISETILYILILALCLYTHITAAIIPIIHITYALFLAAKKEIELAHFFKYLIFSHFIVLLFYSFWLANFISKPLANLKTSAWYFYDRPDNLFFINNIINFFDITKNKFIYYLFLIIIITLVAYFINIITKKAPTFSNAKYLGLFCLTLFFSLGFLSVFGLYQSRYYIIPIFGFIFLTGIIFEFFFLQNKNIKLFFFLLLAIVALPSYIFLFTHKINNWSHVNEFILQNQKVNDKIICAHHNHILPMEIYYSGGLKADALFETNGKENDTLLSIVKTNYYVFVNSQNAGQLNNLLNNQSRVFFVFTEGNYSASQKIALNWFLNNGWTVEKKLSDCLENKLFEPEIYLLIKTDEKINHHPDI